MRFPQFTGDWEKKMFEKICTITTGNKNTQDKEEDGCYPFYVRSATIEKINSYSFDGEAILTAGDGVGVGKVFHYVNGKVGVHQRVYILSDFKCSGQYAYYYFASRFYLRVKRMSAKNSVDSVRRDMIAQMPLTLPDSNEQNKIATFLSLLDERIETQNKIIEKLESLIKGIRQILFIETTTWKSCKVGDVLKIGSGKDYKHLKNGNTPVYGTGGYMLSVNDYLYDGESVCIGRKGTIDRPLFLNGKFWTVDTLFYTYNFQDLLPRFCYYLFGSINWLQYNEASGVPSLSKETIENIQIHLPNICEQEKICSILDAINNKLEVENKVLSVYLVQKKYILNKIFI